MTGYLNTHAKTECFGCSACFQICPQNAITMQPDDEGFLYPQIELARCIQCNLCHHACPAEHSVEFLPPKHGFAGYHHDAAVRMNSASGGAFKAMIDALGDTAIVFGAKWKSRSTVIHSWASTEDAYEQFTGSKYVQSQIGSSFSVCKDFLDSGYTVLFTGTPCQIAGLYTYLRKPYEHLICVDIVCHGVPSSKTLDRYLQCKEKQQAQRISAVRFRQKVHCSYGWDSKCVKTQYENGHISTDTADQNSYMRGFSYGLFFRPSCNACPFSQKDRCSDITIGDAWGITHTCPELNVHQGVSLLMVNSTKGVSFFNDIQKHMVLKELPIDTLVSGNARLRSPDKGHDKRDLFFHMQESTNFDTLIYRCIPRHSFIKRLGHKIKLRLSVLFYNYTKRNQISKDSVRRYS